jgi:dihydroxy-acid dehydratase
VRLIAKRLLDAGYLHGDAPTVSGKTLAEEANEAVEAPGQEVVRQMDDPLKPTGGFAILRGNLAPEGCVVKLAGHDRIHHSGRHASSSRRRTPSRAVKAQEIQPNDVVVIRNEGPAGGPACARCFR